MFHQGISAIHLIRKFELIAIQVKKKCKRILRELFIHWRFKNYRSHLDQNMWIALLEKTVVIYQIQKAGKIKKKTR